MGARNTVPDHVRAAIEHELLNPQDPPRSRAAIAREHDVNPRTVSRYATDLGVAGDPFKTDGIRQATEAATDRRRALRSALADELLSVEIPRLRELLAKGHAGQWRKTVVINGQDAGTELVAEDDYNLARGAKDLLAAVKTATDTTLAVDKTDAADGDDQARKALGDLFGALGKAVEQGLDADEPDAP